jgi:NADH dehydrogenase/NADH:ubiquinone oxidoreductase subunit G
MSKDVKITVDGKEIEAREESSLLSAMLREGFDIPTLCHHEAVAPYGACRLCLVEVNQKGWDADWWKLTTSCNFPVLDGLTVRTESEKILRHRKLVMELILARAPASARVQALAAKLGVDGSRLRGQEDELCILCGLCSRVCDEVIGAHALTFYGRGGGKGLNSPFIEASDNCIGCGACEAVCPTGAVKLVDLGMERKMVRWGAEHEFVPCRICGKPVGTKKQIEYLREKINIEEDIFVTCTECKRDRYARTVVAEGHL